jgi:hypothetical protein
MWLGMSDGPAKFPEGLPVLFFYEDPRERRQRTEGAQPAPSSVVMPPLTEPGQAGPDYPLLRFPWELWQAGAETQSRAGAYASWLNDIAADRLATVLPLLAQAGAPVAGLREEPAMLADLGGWLDALVGSVGHDMALIVADCARAVRPGLA